MPSTAGTSCCATTASRASDICCRICPWCAAGNESRMRETDCAASLVCNVENTKWPVSAAVSTVAMVSGSRISPTRMTSGVCRRMLRSELTKSGVSCPTSICSTMELRFTCWYSTGSSMVTMWTRRCVLIRSIRAASVELLPQPVAPVTSTRPWRRSAMRARAAGRCSDSSVGIRTGRRRMLAARVPRWWWMLARKRPTGSRTKQKSTDFFLLQIVVLARIEQGQDEIAHILGRKRRSCGGGQRAVDAQSDRSAGDQEQVGGILAAGEGQQLIERAGVLRRAGGRRLVGGARTRRGAVQLLDDAAEILVVACHGSDLVSDVSFGGWRRRGRLGGGLGLDALHDDGEVRQVCGNRTHRRQDGGSHGADGGHGQGDFHEGVAVLVADDDAANVARMD